MAPTTGPASELMSTINAQASASPTSDITVQLLDGSGAALSVGGDHVTLSTTLGTLSAVTDNGDSTYSATLTSGTSSTSDVRVDVLLATGHIASPGVPGPANLYTIDPATGVATLIGPIGFDRVGAIDKHPTTGGYYAAAERPAPDNTPVLITIDPITGAGTENGPTGAGP